MAEVLGRGILSGDARAVRRNLRGVAREGLTVFQNGEQDVSVVFVHGLTGQKFATWHDFPRLIAQDPSCAKCEIGFFGYPTALFSLRHVMPMLRPYDIRSKARELADELIAAQTQLGWQKLILAAHSLGGLVVLGALYTCAERRSPSDRHLLRSVKELAFYGTPFLGSDRVGRLTAFFSADLRALFHEDDYRSKILAWTHTQQVSDLLRLDATYARINVLYSATDFWVDTESARARFPGDSQFNSGHTSLCKPESATQRPYLFLAEIIKRSVRESPDAQESRQEFATAQRIHTTDDTHLRAVQHLYEDRLPKEERVPWARILDSLEESPAAQNDPTLNMRYLTIEVSRGQVCGFASALTVKGYRYAWFAYLVAAPGITPDAGRRLAQQLGRELTRSHRECLGFVFEVDDPEALLLSHSDLRRRRARIRLYSMLGPIYHVSGVRYSQPRLEPDSRDPEPQMHLMFAPIPQTSQLRYLTRDEVTAMLKLVCVVQANAFRNHPNARAYQAYLEDWRERQTSGLPACVELKLASRTPSTSLSNGVNAQVPEAPPQTE